MGISPPRLSLGWRPPAAPRVGMVIHGGRAGIGIWLPPPPLTPHPRAPTPRRPLHGTLPPAPPRAPRSLPGGQLRSEGQIASLLATRFVEGPPSHSDRAVASPRRGGDDAASTLPRPVSHRAGSTHLTWTHVVTAPVHPPPPLSLDGRRDAPGPAGTRRREPSPGWPLPCVGVRTFVGQPAGFPTKPPQGLQPHCRHACRPGDGRAPPRERGQSPPRPRRSGKRRTPQDSWKSDNDGVEVVETVELTQPVPAS